MKKAFRVFFQVLLCVLIVLFVFLGLLLIEVGHWVPTVFGDISFEQVVFHLMVPLEGTDTSYIDSFIQECLPLPVIVSLVLSICIVVQAKIKTSKGEAYPLFLRIVSVITVCACTATLVLGADYCFENIRAYEYLDTIKNPSSIYETYYVDPTTVDYQFPEQKRNIIHIYLESMETTYKDIEHGGAMETNLIPELTDLDTLALGGFHVPSGSSWTVAALVGQTSGVPLNIPIDGNSLLTEDSFLPGAYSIGEILEDNGYSNTLLLGSSAEFGGRKYYYKLHGNYDIIDLDTVKEYGWLDDDYNVWWGYEDDKLFDFAKEVLYDLSQKSEPFNFEMLTADTHFTDGYLCPDCPDTFDDQYSNVIACSSKKVSEFISWIQEQPFYENTTIVISGDHLSMDPEWFQSIEDSGYERTGYFTILNSPLAMPASPRVYSTYDIFPTSLASIGVTFSDRLGLGTNLYSSTPTLSEEIGFNTMDRELQRYSKYYNSKILYGE